MSAEKSASFGNLAIISHFLLLLYLGLTLEHVPIYIYIYLDRRILHKHRTCTITSMLSRNLN